MSCQVAVTKWWEKFSSAAEACDHVAIGAALDSVAGGVRQSTARRRVQRRNHVLAQLERAVQAYVDGDEEMGDNAMDAMNDIPLGQKSRG